MSEQFGFQSGRMDRHADARWAGDILDDAEKKEKKAADTAALRAVYEQSLASGEQGIDLRAEAKAEAEAALAVLREGIALAKAKMTMDIATIKATKSMLAHPQEGEDTSAMRANLQEAVDSYGKLREQLAVDEPELKRREAQYVTRFPEVVN